MNFLGNANAIFGPSLVHVLPSTIFRIAIVLEIFTTELNFCKWYVDEGSNFEQIPGPCFDQQRHQHSFWQEPDIFRILLFIIAIITCIKINIILMLFCYNKHYLRENCQSSSQGQELGLSKTRLGMGTGHGHRHGHWESINWDSTEGST